MKGVHSNIGVTWHCWDKKIQAATKIKGKKCDHFGVDWLAVSAEFIGVTLLVVFGCGAAMANGAADASQRLMVSFAFAMSVMVLVYTIAHHSGGQINPAVTFSLVLGGHVIW